MIKFFRKIRQNLLSQGKNGKYFKYAVGEIVLVVIGILIALQINNWNENRKILKQETQIYEELKSDLLLTKKDILQVISKNKEVIQSNQQLLNAIGNKKPYFDTMYSLFANVGEDFKIFPKTSAFENLKNSGLNVLSNDSLRISITNLFQLELKRLVDETGMKSADMMQKLFPYQFKYLFADTNKPVTYGFTHSDSITVYKLGIKNYDQLLTDNNLLLTLQLVFYNRSLFIDEEVKVVESIDNVLDKIEVELNSKNK